MNVKILFKPYYVLCVEYNTKMARVQMKSNPPNGNDSVPMFGSIALVLFGTFIW